MNINCIVFLIVVYLCYGLPSNDFCDGKPCTVEQCKSKQSKCCSNWHYSKKSRTCVPQCFNGCKDGECTAPNTCTCTLPRILHKNKKECVIPKCKDCSNGKCVSDNKCECNEGYVTNGKGCKPICDRCENGDCVRPYTCKCRLGYKLNDKNECRPNCTRSCVNSTCVAPDMCKCNPGFEKTELNHVCKPICKPACENGVCVAPNNCACNKGYERFNDICIPTCEPKCVFGSCVAPNNCSCNEGYKETKFPWKCEPVCENCGNGTCESPNNCTCNKGFERFNDICIPTCEPKCEFGSCVAPNNCSCNEGYKGTKFPWKCEPVCENCGNGTCESPNNCTCNKGFERFNDICIPTCEPKCEFGSCVAPNSCECHSGYERSNVLNVCQRRCEDICQNGLCDNGECTCHSGYHFINNSCEPIPKSSECSNDSCLCEGQPCMPPEAEETKMTTAGIPLIVGGLILVIFILLIAVIGTIYRLNKRGKDKKMESGPEVIPFGSIVYTKPGTLISSDPEIEEKIDHLLQERPDSDEDT